MRWGDGGRGSCHPLYFFRRCSAARPARHRPRFKTTFVATRDGIAPPCRAPPALRRKKHSGCHPLLGAIAKCCGRCEELPELAGTTSLTDLHVRMQSKDVTQRCATRRIAAVLVMLACLSVPCRARAEHELGRARAMVIAGAVLSGLGFLSFVTGIGFIDGSPLLSVPLLTVGAAHMAAGVPVLGVGAYRLRGLTVTPRVSVAPRSAGGGMFVGAELIF
jgi:hypothetical protein